MADRALLAWAALAGRPGVTKSWRELVISWWNRDVLVYAIVALAVTAVAAMVIPHDGYLAWGDVYPLYAMPGNHELERSLQLWGNAYSGLGSPHYAPGTTVLALFGLFLLRLGLSGPWTQWMLALVLLLFAGLSVTFFTRTLFPETRLAALAAGTALPLSFYSANTLHDPIAMFAVGYFPFAAAFLIRRLREPTTPIRFAVEIGLVSLGFMILATAPPIAVYALLWALAWLIGGSLYWRTFPRTWPGLAMGAVAAINVNAWWAYAAFITLFANGGSAIQTFADPVSWSWVDQRATILHLLSMQGAWSWPLPEYYPWASRYQTIPFKLALYFPAVLAMAGLLLSPFRRRTLALLAIVVVSLFVGKGYHPPLREVNAFLYAKLPLYWLFRDPQPATNITLYLSLFALAGVGLAQLVTMTAGRLERLGMGASRVAALSAGAAVALIVLLLANGLPMLTGDFIPKTWLLGDAKSVVMPPHYWSEATAYLDSQQDGSRILLLPNNDFYQMPYDWGYYGADGVAAIIKRPQLIVSTQSINYITGAPALGPQFGHLVDAIRAHSHTSVAPLLSALGVGWILQRNDIVWSRPDRDILSPTQVRSFLASQPHIQKVATFGKLDVYRVAVNPQDAGAFDGLAVWRDGDPPNLLREFDRAGGEVPWLLGNSVPDPANVIKQRPLSDPAQSERRSSAEYDTTISPNARVLVLHSSYSTGWRVAADGHELEWQHLPIDGFLNGWVVPENAPRHVSLFYKPARAYGVLQTLSLIALCCLTVGLVLLSIPKRIAA